MNRVLIVLGVLAVVFIGTIIVHAFFGEEVTFEGMSISPDGMYKCEVREIFWPCQSRGQIKVYAYKGWASGETVWELVKEATIDNDSMCRSSYSIDWEYSEAHQTKKLIVFGDFGTPPFPGEIIFEMAFQSPSSSTQTNEAE